MPDKFSKETRSHIMSRVRGKDTRPEMILRSALHKHGLRYRVRKRFPEINCRPDIVFVSKKIVVFVDGCFWHACPECFKAPRSNKRYWGPKIRANVARDRRQDAWFRKNGWKVVRAWEHEIRHNLARLTRRISTIVKKQ